MKYIRSVFERHPFARYAGLILFAVALVMIPNIGLNDYIMLMFNLTFIYAIVLFGLDFITGIVGQVNAGMDGIVAMGAYTYALLAVRLHISPWICVLASIVMGLFLGVLIGIPSLKISGIYLVLTTLAFGQLVRLLLVNLRGLTYGAPGVRTIPQFSLFGYTITTQNQYFYFLLAWVIVTGLISSIIIKSKWGRVFKALKENEMAVATCGVNVSTIKIMAFMLCTVFGCIAGSLYAACMKYIAPENFTVDMSMRFLMILVVGGVSSVPGKIVGALLITVLPQVLKFSGDSYWLFFCLIVLVFAIKIPGGIMSLVSKHEDRIERLDSTYKLKSR